MKSSISRLTFRVKSAGRCIEVQLGRIGRNSLRDLRIERQSPCIDHAAWNNVHAVDGNHVHDLRIGEIVGELAPRAGTNPVGINQLVVGARAPGRR